MNIDWFTLAAQIINFLILLALLKRFLYGPIREVMDKREKTVIAQLEEARQKQQKADEKAKYYQQKLDTFEQQKEKMKREAREEVEQMKKNLLKQARADIDRMQQTWETSIEDEKDLFFEELHRRTSWTLIELLDKLLKELADSSLEEQAIHKFINQLQAMDKEEQKKALQSAIDQEEENLKIHTSFPLSDKQKLKIRKAIERVFSVPVTCTFEVSLQLGFGIEIRTDGWRMGWNTKIYLDELYRKIGDMFDSEVEVSHN